MIPLHCKQDNPKQLQYTTGQVYDVDTKEVMGRNLDFFVSASAGDNWKHKLGSYALTCKTSTISHALENSVDTRGLLEVE